MAGDRVSEVYHGQAMSAATQAACRERVHWMCAQVVGRRVLDYGCSQGITSLLLAREGHEVVGVDLDPDALAFAERERDSLPEEIRTNLTFQRVIPGRLPFDDAWFDSVLLGEILEHQTRPELLLAEARRLLRPGGRAIVTVPFGLHPHPEHVRTFYLGDFAELTAPHFTTHALLVLNKNICFVGIAGAAEDSGGGRTPDARQLLQSSEKAFLAAETEYHRRHDALAARLADLGRAARRTLERWARRYGFAMPDAAAGDVPAPAARLEEQTRKQLGPTGWIRAAFELGGNVLRRFEQAVEHRDRQLRDAQLRYEDLKRSSEQSQREHEQAQRQLRQQLEQKIRALTAGAESAERQLAEQRARSARLSDQVQHYKEQLRLREQEIRYRLGDALVNAFYRPYLLLALPWTLTRLFAEGLKRRRERRWLKPTATRAAPATPTQLATRAPTPPPTGLAADPEKTPTHAPPLKTPRIQFSPVTRPERPPALPVKAAVIMDEFTCECFQDECRLIPISPENWKQEIEANRPDFLFVESAWKGNNMAWRHRIERAGRELDSPLVALVSWCRKQGLPTVFWNKEDPPNFEHFIFAASLFETIFTSDADCIPRYREHVRHDRIFALPFAAQCAIHNPIGSKRPRPGCVCFAGTYYQHKYPERGNETEMLLRPALSRGLHIFDRNYELQNPRYAFPPEFQNAIQGSLPYPQMLDAYKKYRVFLNVNSVRESPTMFSRRVLELIACGTPVISTYSLGIERLLGGDVVAMVESGEQVAEWLDRLLGDAAIGEQMVRRGQRRIFAEHTYEHRLRTILDQIGVAAPPIDRRVAVITAVERPEQLDAILAGYAPQSYAPRELAVAIIGNAFSPDAVEQRLAGLPGGRAVVPHGGADRGEALQSALAATAAPFVALFDPADSYDEHYLTDLMAAFRYTNAAIIGKSAHYIQPVSGGPPRLATGRQEHEYVRSLVPTAWVALRSVCESIGFRAADRHESRFMHTAVEQGLRMYAADRFSYVCGGALQPAEPTIVTVAQAQAGDVEPRRSDGQAAHAAL